MKDGARTQYGRTDETPFRREWEAKSHLYDALDLHYSSRNFATRAMIGVSQECIVYSEADPAHVYEAAQQAGLQAALSAVARFDAEDPLAYRALWKQLPLEYVVTPTCVLEKLPFSEVDVDWDGEYLAEVDEQAFPRPWTNSEFFLSFDHSALSTVRRLKDLKLPPDLAHPTGEIRLVGRLSSPTERALARVPSKIVKALHKLDDPTAAAIHACGDDPMLEWPDLDQVRRKVTDYCLNRAHRERKWIGFEQELGLASYRPDDAWYLASALSSALIVERYPVYDARPTSDGTLQFSTNVLMPGRFGGYRPVCAAWNVQKGSPLALSTAYIGSYNRPSAAVLKPPSSVMDSNDWPALMKWMTTLSSAYGEGVAASQWFAKGWLWLPHAHKRTRDFASWYRSHHAAGVFNRTRLGGRCTQVVVGPGVWGLSETVGSLRLAQVCLGVSGIRSFMEVELD